jgi:hypothetical protein
MPKLLDEFSIEQAAANRYSVDMLNSIDVPEILNLEFFRRSEQGEVWQISGVHSSV